MKIKQQTINLDMDFNVKERKKIAVFKEIEMNKRITNDLKLEFPKETSKVVQVDERINSDIPKLHLNPDSEKMRLKYPQNCLSSVVPKTSVRQSPSLILMELQQAKLYLARSTCGISDIRASILLLKSMITKEEAMLEKSRERLRLNAAKVSSLEENLRKSMTELELLKDGQSKHQKNSENISNQITKLGLEKEGFKKTTEVAKADAARLVSDTERIKIGIKAVESAETALLTEKAAMSHNHHQKDEHKLSSGVTLSLVEYSQLICKARQSDEKSKKTTQTAMARVREASQSNHNLQVMFEEAIAEVGASRKALQEARRREEAANRGKLAAEEALQRLISKQNSNICTTAKTVVESNRVMLKEVLEREDLANRGKLAIDKDLPLWIFKQKHRIRSVQNSAKFKNPSSVAIRTETKMLDVNGMSLIGAGRSRRLSIGQILSMKLMDTEEYEKEITGRTTERPRISLGQLLSQRNQLMSPTRINKNTSCTKFTSKRRKFGFICLSLILAKQNKSRKNQRQAWSLQSNCRALVM